MITKRFFGKTSDGRDVYEFLFNNGNMRMSVINYGGIIRTIFYKGHDICLGYDTLLEYENANCFFGATVGRYANRIKNGSFILNEREYTLGKNNSGKHHLHGGHCGLNRRIWDYEMNGDTLTLKYLSADMEEGYPGNVSIAVKFTLTGDDEIVIDYHAKTDKDTILNLTNHSYFNLGGQDGGSIEDEILTIFADFYTACDNELIPTGEIRAVADTPFDFRSPKRVGEDIRLEHPMLQSAGGYDLNFVLSSAESIKKAARLSDPKTGITMETYTTKPGIQLYTQTFEQKGKNGKEYGMYHSLCLETQFFPDSINQPHFPSPILRADGEYNHRTIYRFNDWGEKNVME